MKDIETIIKEELSNSQSTLSKYPNEKKYLNDIISIYQTLPSSLKTYPREQVPILQMYWVCFRGLLVSTNLLLQAHIPEAYAIVSRSAEAVASARKMAMNPEKIEGWIKKEKDTSQPFRRILGELFPPKDKVLAPQVFDIYELVTEHGRHPNFVSTIFFSDFGQMNTDNKVTFTYSDINDELNLRRCINYLIYSYLKFLDVFKVVFKDYIKQEWLKHLNQINEEYNVYKESLKPVFLADKNE